MNAPDEEAARAADDAALADAEKESPMSTDPAPDPKLVAERERSRQWENRADTAEMANAALVERLRVAEERNLLADRVLALADAE